MSVVGVIQARLSSSRLPRKVLLPLAGIPVLRHVITRLAAAPVVERIVVATSVDPEDDAIVSACESWGVQCVRGPLDDVLARFCIAIEATNATTIVRAPADKPFLDPAITEALVAAHVREAADYTSNMGPAWPADDACPFGLELEVASAAAVHRADRETQDPRDREHVLPYLYRADHGFKVVYVPTPNPFAPFKPRLNLDTPEDYEVISAAYDALYASHGPVIPASALRALLERDRALLEKNAAIAQRGIR